MVKSQPFMRSILRSIPVVFVAAVLSACGTTKSTASNQTDMRAAKGKNGFLLQASQNEFETLVKNTDIKSKLLNQYSGWKGVRYRLGGTGKNGIDCSAFVQRTFREQFGLSLPRSTSEQQSVGKSINKSKLRVGDLVLFNSGSTGRHIGIYMGNDNFVHASTSKGVMISNLNDGYWKNRYREARRVLHHGAS